MEEYLRETTLLNYRHERVQDAAARWRGLPEREVIEGAYLFCRDEIVMGFNPTVRLTAAKVLDYGCGSGLTKATLLAALLRALGIPCRIHACRINKSLYAGTIPFYIFGVIPKEPLHAWAEVWHDGNWLALDGAALDLTYITRLQSRYPWCDGAYIGNCLATDYFQNPAVEWNGGHTGVQRGAMVTDLGVFASTDELLENYADPLSASALYKLFGRGRMNGKLNKMRVNQRPPKRGTKFLK